MVGATPRRELIRKLRALGFEGPFPGGSHQMMRKVNYALPIPNQREIGGPLLARILKRAGISEEAWEKA